MTTCVLNSSDDTIYSVYPSAFQLVEKPLYYLNEVHNKTSLYMKKNSTNFFKSSLAILLERIQLLVIGWVFWPVIMCATPFTASVDIGVGICEAFYAKYKGASSHQISLIIQKKIIASPIQHLAYVVTNAYATTNLAIPVLCRTLPITFAFCLASSFSIFPISLFIKGSLLYFLIKAPHIPLSSYHFAQKIISKKLPVWARPEGFNIFINGGSLDYFNHKITDEDYTDIEASFRKWAKECIKNRLEEKKKLKKNEQIESVHKRLQGKITIVNAYQNNEFKDFFNRFLSKESEINLLQLSPSFSKEELKKAFKRWSLVLHPDKHTEKDIKEVAEILFKEFLQPALTEFETKFAE